jgi:hypothetical protein
MQERVQGRGLSLAGAADQVEMRLERLLGETGFFVVRSLPKKMFMGTCRG